MHINKVHSLQVLLFLSVLLACLAVYFPGLNGPFLVDDTSSLQALNDRGGVVDFESLRAFVFGNNSGVLGRPVSMLSFLLNDQYYPGDPASYKYTNLLIHCLCGVFVYLLSKKLILVSGRETTYSEYVSLAVMALWLMSPLNVSTVLYVVQRMTQLSTLFTLIALLFYLSGRCDKNRTWVHSLCVMSFGIGVFGFLAILSKENGILLLMYIVVLELSLLRGVARPQYFSAWFTLVVLIPLLVFVGYLIYSWPGFIRTYQYRSFDLTSRLLTEARILIEYARQVFVPTVSGTGLVHDDIIISESIFSPVTTLLALVMHAGIIFATVIALIRKRCDVACFGVAWFYTGHILESTFIPLELYFEHRNYLPMFSLLFMSAWGLLSVVRLAPRLKLGVLSFAVIWILWASVFCAQSSRIWGNPYVLYGVWASEHPESLRARTMYGRFLNAVGNHEEAIAYLDKSYKDFPDAIQLPIATLTMACQQNITPKYTLDDIVARIPISRYYGATISVLENLVEVYKSTGCDYLDKENTHKLMAGLLELKGLVADSRAKIALWNSELYEKDRDLSGAMRWADRAFEYQPISIVRFKQAVLLYRLGVYEGALDFIDLAIAIEPDAGILNPGNKSLYQEFREKILLKINM